MATKKQLRDRWKNAPGSSIIAQIYALGIIDPGHGHKSEEIFGLLDALPFRSEIPNGRDLRGAAMAGRELSLQDTDFSYGRFSSFDFCDLSGSRFDECTAERSGVGDKANCCSFIKARLRSCYFHNGELRNCNFNDAWLRGCSFQNADLTGSSFRNADCRRVAFAKCKLVGCDFRGAILEEAVFEDLEMDKSTDIRGADLMNIYNTDRFDSQGNLVARGSDWRQCTYDHTTRVGTDEAAMDREIVDAVKAVLDSREDPVAEQIQTFIRAVTIGRGEWKAEVESRLDKQHIPYWEEVVHEAYKSLL